MLQLDFIPTLTLNVMLVQFLSVTLSELLLLVFRPLPSMCCSVLISENYNGGQSCWTNYHTDMHKIVLINVALDKCRHSIANKKKTVYVLQVLSHKH